MAAKVTQVLLWMICALLQATKMIVLRLHGWMLDPPEAEAMGEGRVPESVEFALRGDIECLVADHLDPAIEMLRRSGMPAAAREE